MNQCDLTYREGYVKALRDIVSLLERSEVGLKGLRANNVRGVCGMLLAALDDPDWLMSRGDMTDFELVGKSKRGTVFRMDKEPR